MSLSVLMRWNSLSLSSETSSGGTRSSCINTSSVFEAACQAFERHGIRAWIEDDHVELSPDAVSLEEAHTILSDARLALESFHVERHDLETALLNRLREHREALGAER